MGTDEFGQGKPKRVGRGGLAGQYGVAPGHRSKPPWKLQLSQYQGVKARKANGNAQAAVEKAARKAQREDN